MISCVYFVLNIFPDEFLKLQPLYIQILFLFLPHFPYVNYYVLNFPLFFLPFSFLSFLRLFLILHCFCYLLSFFSILLFYLDILIFLIFFNSFLFVSFSFLINLIFFFF